MALDIYFHHTPLEFTGDKTNIEDIKSYLKCVNNTAKNDLRQFTEKGKKILEPLWEKGVKNRPVTLSNGVVLHSFHDYNSKYFSFVVNLEKIISVNRDYMIHPYTEKVLDYPDLLKELDSTIAEHAHYYDAYFRKVNFLYKYFEDRGKMIDQRFAFVDKDDVDVLIDRCQRVIAATNNLEKIGPDLLPTQSGFFFGSTDYDKWYLDDVKDCLKKMKTYRKFFKDGITCYAIFSW